MQAGVTISADCGDMPVDGQSYSASSAFGAGDAIGGAFVVFNGSGNAVSLSQLQQNTTYFVKVIEYNCDPELYLSSGNPSTSFTTDDFASSTTISFASSTASISTETQTQVTLQLDEPLNAASSVELLVTTTNGLVNGTDFSTSPSSTSGTFTINISAETSQINFTVESLTSTTGDVVFTIFNTSSNLSAENPNTFTLTIDGATGLEDDLAAAGLAVFPNPTQAGVFIRYENFKEAYGVKLLSASGKLIKNQTVTQSESFVDFPKLSQGVYFLQIAVDGQLFYKRLVIQ